ncbi:MAG: thiolase family protein [Candidatus Margulisiibacteriota bacterium]|nr:thiolase family protein [Candidatus Margulisiibacteriota bacterium]
MNERIAIVNAFRTPFLKAGTDFRGIDADQLGVYPLKESILRSSISFDDVDDVVIGCCGQPAHAANVARVIALRAGIPKSVPAVTVHRNCASGMEAISTGAQRLLLGDADVVATAGVEAMSNYPLMYGKEMRVFFDKLFRAKTFTQRLAVFSSFRFRHLKPLIALKLGLTDPVCNLIMGQTAENIAKEFKISREEQDDFSLQSHLKALKSQEEGIFDDEIIPIQLPAEYNKTIIKDNGPRVGQTIDALKKLKPYFDRKLGSVTVGSSSQITDGAGAMLLMRESTAKAKGIKPLGYLSGYAYAGCNPETMGMGPTFAAHKLMRQQKLNMDDIDLVEINEAFAAQVLGNVYAFESEAFAKKELNDTKPLGKLPLEKLNVNGGAIALGHPLAASGQRIVMTLLYELHRQEKQRGLATLCVGGGQGGAFLLERH